MKVCDILKNKDFLLSFEFFPPKKPEQEDIFWNTVNRLKRWMPDFVSVTYGAGGSTHEKTLDISVSLKNMGYNVVMHLTCIMATAEKILSTLDYLRKNKIENILALRGDIPEGEDKSYIERLEFKYAWQLVDFIRKNGDFCIGVAGYPEGHPESPSLEKDIEYLKFKLDKGADFVVTQLFFDNSKFYRFIELVKGAGIDKPVIPGIMPITSYGQIVRFTNMCGVNIPKDLLDVLERYKDSPEDLRKAGIDYTIRQCSDLIKNGVKGLHFYTLNRYPATDSILENISSELEGLR